MRTLLLQEERYFPTYGGGHKSNRLLLEALAAAGHHTTALCPAFNAQRTTAPQWLERMRARGVHPQPSPEGFRFELHGVRVRGTVLPSLDDRQRAVRDTIDGLRPDCVFVADDPRRYLLEPALQAAPGRVVFVVHGLLFLPFGPLSRAPDPAVTERMRQAARILVVSRFAQDYLREHAGLASQVVHFPVYGDPPPRPAAHARFVTLIKPYPDKGLDLLIQLAQRLPDVAFAAVRSWESEANPAIDAQLDAAGIHVLAPHDDVGEILAQTRVLLAPSLLPETFGLVVVEALLRGVPVLCSGVGGQREAALGVATVLPVRPIERWGEPLPLQDAGPWVGPLTRLLDDPAHARAQSAASRDAARAFVSTVDIAPFEQVMGARSPVAIVDPYDAAQALAPELRRLGRPCVWVSSSPCVPDAIRGAVQPQDFCARVDHDGDVEQTAASLRALGVQLVVPGCETGVRVADQLAHALGSPTANPLTHSVARRHKHHMSRAVARAGLPVAEELLSSDPAALLDWARDRYPVVIKRPASLNSDGVALCDTPAQLADAARQILGVRNQVGQVDDHALVQRLLRGDQYVVDTVSCQGRHRLAALWRYTRPEIPPGPPRPQDEALRRYARIGSDGKVLLAVSSDAHRALVDYALGVLEALQIHNGPAHCELVLEADGPRLVEIGARLHGGPRTAWMARRCVGVDQVQLAALAACRPERFLAQSAPYAPSHHGAMVRLTPWRSGVLRGLRRLDEIEALPSYQERYYMAEPGRPVPRVAGVVALIHPDAHQLERDMRRIRALERQDLYDLAPMEGS